MDSKKLGVAAASLLGAATVLGIGASPASADIVIICPCEEGPAPGADPFLKLELSFSKIMSKIVELKGTDSDVMHKIQTNFDTILLK